MSYEVEFQEKATILRTVACIVEADSEEEVEEKVKKGEYEFDDCWDDDELETSFVKILDIKDDEE